VRIEIVIVQPSSQAAAASPVSGFWSGFLGFITALGTLLVGVGSLATYRRARDINDAMQKAAGLSANPSSDPPKAEPSAVATATELSPRPPGDDRV
jgi:hypothetical protein